jgi:hypothetical protein
MTDPASPPTPRQAVSATTRTAAGRLESFRPTNPFPSPLCPSQPELSLRDNLPTGDGLPQTHYFFTGDRGLRVPVGLDILSPAGAIDHNDIASNRTVKAFLVGSGGRPRRATNAPAPSRYCAKRIRGHYLQGLYGTERARVRETLKKSAVAGGHAFRLTETRCQRPDDGKAGSVAAEAGSLALQACVIRVGAADPKARYLGLVGPQSHGPVVHGTGGATVPALVSADSNHGDAAASRAPLKYHGRVEPLPA